jgi:two-component system response regulator AtoC
MSALNQVIAELAASDIPVLLVGEPGVGKHLVARQIHEASPWREMPMLECDCRVTNEGTIRSAFEPESDGRSGPSTVYFENIESLSVSCQRALLSCFETHHGQPRFPRVIASGSTNLEIEVRGGHFREDLYYKLSGVCLLIPPLRYRKDEIVGIADQFLEKYATEFSRARPELTPTLVRFLQSHPWMGNLRELEDAMRTMVAVGNIKVAITALQSSASTSGRREKKNGNESTSLKQVARAASQRAERELILKALSRTHWNRKKAAQELRISYKALLYKLKEIGTGKTAVTGPGGIVE